MKTLGNQADVNVSLRGFNFIKASRMRLTLVTLSLVCLLVLALASPALAHHPFGGAIPGSWRQGLLSGIGHPIIGPDHFIFMVVVGLLATRFRLGGIVSGAFLLATLLGTGIHLIGWNLPAPELFIALSVLLFGGLAACGYKLNLRLLALLALFAGIFHGYAYGEAIVGAEVTPLMFYLVGFTVIQGAILAIVSWITYRQHNPARALVWLRTSGLFACGAGGVFLSSLAVG